MAPFIRRTSGELVKRAEPRLLGRLGCWCRASGIVPKPSASLLPFHYRRIARGELWRSSSQVEERGDADRSPCCSSMEAAGVAGGWSILSGFKSSLPSGTEWRFSDGFLTKSPVDTCHSGQPGETTDPKNPMKSIDDPPCKGSPPPPPINITKSQAFSLQKARLFNRIPPPPPNKTLKIKG